MDDSRKNSNIPLIIQHRSNGESVDDICHWLGTSKSRIYRICKNWNEFGLHSSSVHPLKCLKRGPKFVLDSFCETFLIQRMEFKPSTTLKEYKQMLVQYYNVNVCISVISRFFTSRGISYKKLCCLAYESNAENIRIFMRVIHTLVTDARQLVFLDESHRNSKTANRKYGRGWKCGRAVEYNRYTRGSYSLSLLLAADIYGPLAYEVFHGAVNAERLIRYLLRDLLPFMNVYPGPRSILILDNCSIHHSSMMQMFRYYSGSLVIYLPPYCPFLNLVEYYFNGIKMLEKKDEVHDEWGAYMSLCWNTEQMRDRNWLSILKQLKYV